MTLFSNDFIAQRDIENQINNTENPYNKKKNPYEYKIWENGFINGQMKSAIREETALKDIQEIIRKEKISTTYIEKCAKKNKNAIDGLIELNDYGDED